LNLLREDPEAVPDTKLARQLVAEANARDPALSGTEGEHSYNGVFREMIVASIFARRGQRDSARSILARATAAVAGDTEMSIDLHFDEAYVQLLLGDRTRAIELLRLYLTARPNLKAFLGRDPLFRGLRTDSSFAAILRGS
jgi:tetratricopeptide (TPR) repeat protein